MKNSLRNGEISEFSKKIAAFVKEKREEKNWTRFMLCKKSGCSFLTVKSIEENEVKDYKAMTISKLLRALDTSIVEFYQNHDESSNEK